MDLSELRDIDSLHIEGIDTLLKGGLGWKIFTVLVTRSRRSLQARLNTKH